MIGFGTAGFLFKPVESDSFHNYPRIDSFDIPRAIAIALMVIVHTLMMYASPAALQQPMTKLLMLSGTAPGAPTFMFLMGFYFIYARPKPMRCYLVRGLQLILMGYLLNILRFLIPAEFILLLRVPAEVFAPWTPLLFFKTIDILQFAGLAMIIMTAIRCFCKRPVVILLIMAAVTLSSPFLWGIHSGMVPVDWLLDLLWGTDIFVTFPLFPWLVYPLAGYLFGLALISIQGQDTFFSSSCLLGLFLYITGMVISAANPTFHYGDYFRAGYGGTICMLGFVTCYISSVELLCRKIGVKGRIKGVSYLSDNLTELYFIHWIIIGWSMVSGYTDKLSLTECFFVMGVVAVLSLLVLKGWHYFRENEFTIEGLGNPQNTELG